LDVGKTKTGDVDREAGRKRGNHEGPRGVKKAQKAGPPGSREQDWNRKVVKTRPGDSKKARKLSGFADRVGGRGGV